MRIPGISGATAKEALRAHARYPDVDVFLALSFMDSDRRAAGLGALGKRPVRWPRPVYRTKVADYGGTVTWVLGVNYPERREIPLQPLPRFPMKTAPRAMTVTVIRHPPRTAEVCVRWDARDLQTEQGRHVCARLLREARRQLREKGEAR